MRAHARGEVTLASPVRVNLFLSDSRVDASQPVAYAAEVTQSSAAIEKAPAPGPADVDVHATTADWKACILGGADYRDLPGIRVVDRAAAVEALVRATSLNGHAEAS